MTRKTTLAAWLTEVISLCMEQQPLLLFFHGSSEAAVADKADENDSAGLRDSGDSTSDALKDLVLISHVTIRVAPAPTVRAQLEQATSYVHTHRPMSLAMVVALSASTDLHIWLFFCRYRLI
jgi:hypothetical protein